MSFIKTETMKLLRHTIQYKLNIYKTTKNLPAKSLTRQQLMTLYKKLSYESPLWKMPSHTKKVMQTFLNVWGQSSSPYEPYHLEHSQADELLLCSSEIYQTVIKPKYSPKCRTSGACVFALLQYDHVPFAFIALMCARWSSLLNA